MNNKRRDKVKNVIKSLTEISQLIEVISDAEQDCIDNMPENLQETERYENMESAAENLGEAAERVDEAIECLEAAIA